MSHRLRGNVGSADWDVRRRLENLRSAHDERLAGVGEILQIAREDEAYDRLLAVFRSASVTLLILGQGACVVERDAQLAKRTFAGLTDWLPLFEGAMEGGAGKTLDVSFGTLLEPVVCMLLARDSRGLNALADTNGRLFRAPAKENKASHPRCQLARYLIALLGGRSGPAAPFDKDSEGDRNDLFAAYLALLPFVVAGDDEAFERTRAELEASYPARRKLREDALNWFGAGPLAQTATFDALGTAICHLAARLGLRVDVDTPLYPRAFIRR